MTEQMNLQGGDGGFRDASDGGRGQGYTRARAPPHVRLRRRDLPQFTEDSRRGVARSVRGRPPVRLGPLLPRRPGRPDRHAQDTLRPAYHHYMGDPLEVLMLYPDGTGTVTTVGSDLAAGQRPQLFVPGDTFHTSRLGPGADYALLASTEWPGVEPPDVEHGDIEALVESYPDMAEHIRAFTSGAR